MHGFNHLLGDLIIWSNFLQQESNFFRLVSSENTLDKQMIRPNFNLRLSNFIKKWMFHFFFSSDYSVWQHHFRLLEWMKNDAQPCFGQSTIMTLWNAKWLWFKMSDNFGWSSDRQIDISRFSCYIYLHKHCLLTYSYKTSLYRNSYPK